MKYYILVRRRGSSKYLGAIPTRKGVSLATVRKVVRKYLKRGFVAKIVSENQLKRYLRQTRVASPKRTRRVHRIRRTRSRRVKRIRHKRHRIHRKVRRHRRR